jgi:hypothetical protein
MDSDNLDREALFHLTEQLRLLEVQNREFEVEIQSLIKKVTPPQLSIPVILASMKMIFACMLLRRKKSFR